MLACVGDIHLEKLEHIVPEFNSLVIKALVSTLNKVLDKGCQRIILMGDIFDTPFPSQTSIVQFLSAMTGIDAKIYIIPGNHDFSANGVDSLILSKWVSEFPKSNLSVITQPKILKIDGVRYFVCPHPYVENMPSKADLAIGHFAVNGSRGDNGFKVRTKHSPKGDWILGDFHTPQRGRAVGCKFQYAGSITQLSWMERPNKSILLLEDGERHKIKVDSTYTLTKEVIGSDSDLGDYSDTSTYYYLQTKGDYSFPKGWLMDHPQVVRTSTFGKKKDKRAQVLLDEAKANDDPLSNLETFLKTKNLTGSTIERALEIADGIKL